MEVLKSVTTAYLLSTPTGNSICSCSCLREPLAALVCLTLFLFHLILKERYSYVESQESDSALMMMRLIA